MRKRTAGEGDRERKCERCDHVWNTRKGTTTVRVCPSCKSPYWDIPVGLKNGELADFLEEVTELN